MSFRAYSAPKGTPDVSLLGRESMLFKELATLDQALSWIRHVDKTAAFRSRSTVTTEPAWTRREIAAVLRVGQREQVGGPSVT